MSFFRGGRRKQVTPVKKALTDTITASPIIPNVFLDTTDTNDIPNVALRRRFRPNSDPQGTALEGNQNGGQEPDVLGGQVAIDITTRSEQDSATMTGLGGRISFSIASVQAGTTQQPVLYPPAFSVGVSYAVVHVRQGQTPGPLISFFNYPVDAYDPQKDLLAYGTGFISATSSSAQGGLSSQVPVTIEFEIGTKRTLKKGDYLTLIVATNMPQNVGVVAYTASIRCFLITS